MRKIWSRMIGFVAALAVAITLTAGGFQLLEANSALSMCQPLPGHPNGVMCSEPEDCETPCAGAVSIDCVEGCCECFF